MNENVFTESNESDEKNEKNEKNEELSRKPKKKTVVNRAQLKKYLLERARKTRPQFTRVGIDVLDAAEDELRRWADQFVRSHPSLGKTLLTGTRKRKNSIIDVNVDVEPIS